MKDIEIVIFQDKSWVRLTEYQKVKEENDQLVKYCKELEAGFLNYKKNYKIKRQKVFDLETIGKNLEKENEKLRQQIGLYKEMLNRNPCVRIPDWHCSDCLEENTKLKQQIEKAKNCHNCKHSYHDRYHTLQCIRNCFNFDNWELAE